jgi:putative membrane protein
MTESDVHATANAQVKLAKSAGALRDSAQEQLESAERRTVLAADRTVLAAERTYAAWVRTGLASLAAGIGARALLSNVVANWLIITTSAILILFSGFCFIAGVWRDAYPGAPPPPDTRRLPTWLLLLVNGFLLFVSLAALIGVWP